MVFLKKMNEFDIWNQKKQEINLLKNELFIQEREIWIAFLGKNIGVELNGKRQNFIRPVLIYRKYNSHQCFIFPLTKGGKRNRFYHDLSSVEFLKEKSFLSLSQGRVIDTKRVFRKIGKISVGQLQNIKKSAQAMLEPQSPRWL